MRHPAWYRFLTSPGNRLVGVFLVFILLPGIVLGAFALRTLRQERRLAHQQIQDQLDRITVQVGRGLELQFKEWQQALQSTATAEMADPSSWPKMIRQAVETPGSGVIFWRDENLLRTFPSSQLLYAVTAVSSKPQRSLPSSFTQAESVELGQKDYPRAIRLYQTFVDSADVHLQPLVLHRLARTYRKAGRLDEAVQAYQKLERLPSTTIGEMPSDLIAKSELCDLAAESGDTRALAREVLALYRDLVEGRWHLEKPRYMYYSDRCRTWIGASKVGTGEISQVEALEERKRALTRAVEEFLAQPKRFLAGDTALHFAFWQDDPFRAVVVSGEYFGSHLWPRVSSAAEDQAVHAVLETFGGKPVFGSLPGKMPSLSLTRTIQVDGQPWRLVVWPADPASFYSDLRQRQDLYMGTLLFVVALLVFGSYITARTVKREIEVARLRADFVSTVSHEFRSPLTGIRQLGEMLLRGRVAGEERQRHYYRMIVHESERLGRLVENLLDFSRMEEGRKEYRFAPLDTTAWLRDLVADFQSEIGGKGVSVETRIPEDLPVISADREALGCAVHNLLDNAVKYSARSKTVWFDADAGNGNMTISVRDRGVGIPEGNLKHIFEKFYRVDGEISQQVKGAGLGLSLVQHTVTAHGGTVECESRVGEGSTFSIRLPVGPPAGGGEQSHGADPGCRRRTHDRNGPAG
jgi:signal transduction histidine kinase/tetratricopeptide (TPR) repeat protein